MKIFLTLLFLFPTALLAQVHRPCSNEVLSCKVERLTMNAPRVLISTEEVKFDGVNWDEPSIPPSECSMIMNIEGENGLIFVVNLGDSDYQASLYNIRRPNFGKIEGAMVSFPVVKGKTFYLHNDDQLLTCHLKAL